VLWDEMVLSSPTTATIRLPSSPWRGFVVRGIDPMAQVRRVE
jgi:hypothetical protein